MVRLESQPSGSQYERGQRARGSGYLPKRAARGPGFAYYYRDCCCVRIARPFESGVLPRV